MSASDFLMVSLAILCIALLMRLLSAHKSNNARALWSHSLARIASANGGQ